LRSANKSDQSGEAGDFEAAVDAVVAGDLPALDSLIRQNGDLIRARSTHEHRATLLHYVSANGVEDSRQKTPPNVVDITKLLLEAGAEVDACADTYGGGTGQTTMNLLVSSVHPAKAGLQEALVETLLDSGAAVNGLEDDGSPLMTALRFGYGAAAEALVRRGARVDNIVAAASLGRLDLVERFLVEGYHIKPSLVALRWVPLTNDRKRNAALSLVWACVYAQTAIVEFLLEQGVDPAASDADGMTGLHWAAANRYVDVVELLLQHGAPLEARNRWGGTVLDSTGWFVAHDVWFPATLPSRQRLAPSRADYATVMEALIAAGADLSPMQYATGDRSVDRVLERHRGRPG
jgi:ankyrin repeat protein